MAERTNDPPRPLPSTEEQIRAATVGEPQPLSGKIQIAEYDPRWPEIFKTHASRIRATLGERALQIEHVGSTSVPGLPAKPIIDILLVVRNSAEEDQYVAQLEGAGYILRIRESDWHQHRMFRGAGNQIHLHVFSAGCPEIERMLTFRDWLQKSAADRDLYAQTKRALAQQNWKYMQNYADAKTEVIEEIMNRARK